MKICIVTTPIRPIPTNFPPLGSMAIIQSLWKILPKENIKFHHIDFHRYSHKDNVEYFKKNNFDMVGISAVVSTAYAYTKYLSSLIKSINKKTIVFVGGGLAASAEICANESGLQEQVIVQETQVFETGEMRVMKKSTVGEFDVTSDLP